MCGDFEGDEPMYFTHWKGNVLEDGPWCTDGHLLLDTRECHIAALAVLLERDELDARKAPQAGIAKLLKSWQEGPGVSLKAASLRDAGSLMCLELARADGESAYVNAQKWLLAWGASSFDMMFQHGGVNSAVVLFRGDRLVGVLMPINMRRFNPRGWPAVTAKDMPAQV